MTTAQLHVIGSAHEARFGESFDADLTAALALAHDPARAAVQLDELGLLGVLAHYAAAGPYEPQDQDVRYSWGLEPDPGDRRLRRHHCTVHYSATRVDVFIFTGVAVAPSQTIVGTVTIRPEVLT